MATLRERPQKDGTITYQVVFRHGGKQRSKTFANRKSAQRWQKLVEAVGPNQALAALYTSTENQTTLDEIAEQYWQAVRNRVRSERTVLDYERSYNKHASPIFGWRPAADIDETDIQAWVEDMRKNLSPKTVGAHHAVLHGMFKWAGAPSRKLIPMGHNPCIGTELPKKAKPAPKGLRPNEWQALWIALTNINQDAADLAEFLVASGWRWSEATALDTYNCEDDGEHVWVTMSQVVRRDENNQFNIVQDAKSRAGIRRIQLDQDASEMVRRRLQNTPRGGLVFTSPEGHIWHYSNFRDRYWNPAVELANLNRRPTIHWLRHTAVAYLVMSRQIALPEIQKRIGHESIQTTIDVYGTMIQDVSPEALDFAAKMRGPRPKAIGNDKPALED